MVQHPYTLNPNKYATIGMHFFIDYIGYKFSKHITKIQNKYVILWNYIIQYYLTIGY